MSKLVDQFLTNIYSECRNRQFDTTSCKYLFSHLPTISACLGLFPSQKIPLAQNFTTSYV